MKRPSLELTTDCPSGFALVRHAASGGTVHIAPEVHAGLAERHTRAAATAAVEHAYGRTTGVGANRDIAADDADGGHGVRLLRSHASGVGACASPLVGATTMLIRAAQLVRGNSGIAPDVVVALVAAINDGRTVPVRAYGGLGTGDITVLAELGLCLLGELPWADGGCVAYLFDVDASSALALMSSSAPTLAHTACSLARIESLVQWAAVAAGESMVAVCAQPQQWSAGAEVTRPSAGVSWVMQQLRSTVGDRAWQVARTQDPVSFRSLPWVLGALRDRLDALAAETDRCVAACAENPTYTASGVAHHGAFHLTSLALELDATRLALTQYLSHAVSRVGKLVDPTYTGGARFAADGPDGASGVMVVEYTMAGAVQQARQLADPVSRHSVTISLGTEEHASFATTAAQMFEAMLEPAAVAVAAELLVAARVLQMSGRSVANDVADLLARCGVPSGQFVDRALGAELQAVAAALVQ